MKPKEITLRNYFAAKALSIVPFLAKESWPRKAYIDEAYKIADLMLEESLFFENKQQLRDAMKSEE